MNDRKIGELIEVDVVKPSVAANEVSHCSMSMIVPCAEP